MRVVSLKIAISASCGRYIFRNFIYETKTIMSEYVVPNGFSSASKQMTLYDIEYHFAINTVFRVASFSVDVLVLRYDCFKINGDVHTASGKDVQ